MFDRVRLWIQPRTDRISPIMVCYGLDGKFHSDGCVENLKLQFDHNSFYLCLLYLVLLWLGILMLNMCSEKYHGIKLINKQKLSISFKVV